MYKDTLQKLYSIFLVNAVILIPLIFSESILLMFLNWKILFMILINSLVIWTQPPMKSDEFQSQSDKNTGHFIFFAVVTSLFFSTLELSFFCRDILIVNVIGLIICFSGLIFRIKAIKDLNKEFSNIIKKPTSLRTTGLYSIVQHPAYSGSLFTYIGLSILLSQGYSIIICSVLIFTAYKIRIKHENKCLQETFNEIAIEYQNKTKILIPFIW